MVDARQKLGLRGRIPKSGRWIATAVFAGTLVAGLGLLYVEVLRFGTRFSADRWTGKSYIGWNQYACINRRLPVIEDLMTRVLPPGSTPERVIEVLGYPEHRHQSAITNSQNPTPHTTWGDMAYVVWTTGGTIKSRGPLKWLVISFEGNCLVRWRIEEVGGSAFAQVLTDPIVAPPQDRQVGLEAGDVRSPR